MSLLRRLRLPVAAVRQVAIGLAFTAVVILLLLWLAGTFHAKIDAEHSPAAVQNAGRPLADADRTAPVRLIEIPDVETAVGTIRAVHETSVASKILARVVEVAVRAGQAVSQGDVLVRLDDVDLKARAQQAHAAVEAARAARDQAKTEYDRIVRLHGEGHASQVEFDRATTSLRAAEAEVARSTRAAAEADAVLSYATIAAPIGGIVIDKRVEVGDTAVPGQVLVTLYDPTRMQLVASVRESLTHRLRVGQTIGVRVDALAETCEGTIAEIVPEADAASRAFSVKVTGPCPPGIYSGMFGRLQIPLDARQALVIPQDAVRRVGQLTLVEVVVDGRAMRRAVQIGRDVDGGVEVLSGLREGERVVVQAARARSEPGGAAS